MIKINFSSFFFLIVFMGCANTYKLEKKSVLSFSESYYSSWSSGVNGGGSGFNVYLKLDETIILGNINIKGIYFKDTYTNLKYQGSNKYQGNIKENRNSDKLELEKKLEKNIVIKKVEEIPFYLKPNEAVVSYLKGSKQEYVKIILNKKKTLDFPM